MKRRTTFFHEGGANFDPSQLSLSSNALEIRDLHAARQERFTFAIDEVPDEVCVLYSARFGAMRSSN